MVHARRNALIRRSIDLLELYRHAAVRCEPGLAMILRENVQTLGQLIDDLQAQARLLQGAACVRGSWRGSLRWHAAVWLLRASSNRDEGWIQVLAHAESDLLQEFEACVENAPAPLSKLVHEQLPRLRGIHLDMHMLVGSAR